MGTILGEEGPSSLLVFIDTILWDKTPRWANGYWHAITLKGKRIDKMLCWQSELKNSQNFKCPWRATPGEWHRLLESLQWGLLLFFPWRNITPGKRNPDLKLSSKMHEEAISNCLGSWDGNVINLSLCLKTCLYDQGLPWDLIFESPDNSW